MAIFMALLHFLRDRSGASAAEYALILAIVGSAIALASFLLGETIANAMNDTSECIAGATSAACT